MNTSFVLSNIWAISGVITALFFIIKLDSGEFVTNFERKFPMVPREILQAITVTVMILMIVAPIINTHLAYCVLRKMFRYVMRLRYPNF